MQPPLGVGIAKSDYPVTTDTDIEDASTSSTYSSSSGNIRGGGTSVSDNTAFGANYGFGILIGVALDLDNGMIWWSREGSWQDVTLQTDPENALNPAVSGLNSVAFSGPWFATVWLQSPQAQATANFGATAFTHTVPSGFNAGFGPA